MPYTVGQTVHLTATFKDTTGALTDPASPVVNITTPAGVSTQTAAVKDSTGTYHYDYTPAVPGSFTWWFSGTGVAQLPDIFTVTAGLSGALISIADARAQINDQNADAGELWRYIQAATEIINRKCGYTASTQFTETVAGRADSSGRTTLVLSRTPVLSVQSITSQMQGVVQTYDVTAVVDNPESGVIYLSNWWQFYGPLVVTYTAGRGFVPAALQTACALIVEHLWETQRGGGVGAPGLGGDEMDMAMTGLPYRAVQLMDMAPYDAAPGIA